MTVLPLRPICLIRHGQTDANRGGTIAGRNEAMLTDCGKSAARSLADHVWPDEIKVFVSPQHRARDTAALAFPNHPHVIVNSLRERDWGIYEGRDVRYLPPRTETPEGGEGWDEMQQRVASAITICVTRAGSQLPVIVAHSGVVRAVRALTGGNPHGPSVPNTMPLLFRPEQGLWHEQPFFK